jgi:hypothetical protein
LTWDGCRALVSVDAGKVVLRSPRDTARAPAFPEIVAGAARLPDSAALDSELVVGGAGSASSGCRTGFSAAVPGRPGQLTRRRAALEPCSGTGG